MSRAIEVIDDLLRIGEGRRFTGRQAWRRGLPVLLVGGAAATATFLIGKWLGVSAGL